MNAMQGVSDIYTGVSNLLKSPDVQTNLNLILKGLGELGLMKAMVKAMGVPSAHEDTAKSHEVKIEQA